MRIHSSIKVTIRIIHTFCLLIVVFVTCVQAQVDIRDHLSAEERQRWFPIRRMLVVEGRADSADQLGSGFAMLPDANGDGWNDLAVSAQNRREMLIFYGGPGILDSIPDAVMPGGGTIATGDFNGDSLQEIAGQQPGSIMDRSPTACSCISRANARAASTARSPTCGSESAIRGEQAGISGITVPVGISTAMGSMN